ncbi:MAG: DUF554 domain-containing protein [Bacteroidota bacterium]|nr:DUF554 domain-containing protein [Bacteroidota bacterium]
MYGTLINAGAVIVGGILGLIIRSGLPKNIIKSVFQVIGLFTLVLGMTMAQKTDNYLLIIFSIVGGTVLGELLGLEVLMRKFSDFLKSKFKLGDEKFTEGFISSFLLFCMGSMTILGALEEGLGSEPNLLLAKSVMDGFGAMALAASMGVGVLFSVIPLLLYQGGLTYSAAFAQDLLTESLQNEITAVGGILLLGLGINILEIKQLKILNMTPALFIALTLYFSGLFS